MARCVMPVVATLVLGLLAFGQLAEEAAVKSDHDSAFARLPPDGATLDAIPLVEGGEPALSPDNRTVAFVRYGSGVWLYDLKTKSEWRVCANSNAHAVSWSPDGRQMAFQGDDTLVTYGKFWIWMVNRDGRRLRKLEESGPHDQYPRWAPDGAHIAWSRGERLYVADTAGQSGRYLTCSRGPGLFEMVLAWAPDGKHLLYIRSTDRNQSIYEMRRLGSDSTDDRPDPTGIAPGNLWYSQLSPDGSLLCRGDADRAFSLTAHGESGETRHYMVADSSYMRIGRVVVSGDHRFALFDNDVGRWRHRIWKVPLRGSAER